MGGSGPGFRGSGVPGFRPGSSPCRLHVVRPSTDDPGDLLFWDSFPSSWFWGIDEGIIVFHAFEFEEFLFLECLRVSKSSQMFRVRLECLVGLDEGNASLASTKTVPRWPRRRQCLSGSRSFPSLRPKGFLQTVSLEKSILESIVSPFVHSFVEILDSPRDRRGPSSSIRYGMPSDGSSRRSRNSTDRGLDSRESKDFGLALGVSGGRVLRGPFWDRTSVGRSGTGRPWTVLGPDVRGPFCLSKRVLCGLDRKDRIVQAQLRGIVNSLQCDFVV